MYRDDSIGPNPNLENPIARIKAFVKSNLIGWLIKVSKPNLR